MITVIEVKTRKEIKEFIEFPLRLYKGNEYFAPPLYGDELALFGKKNVYIDQAESVFYLAKEDGKTVGRIQGILQRASNAKWNQKRVRFTRFDSIDRQDVADALFARLEEWAKERGMDTLVGPLGYSDLEREGLLIEGFDQLSTFEEQYNYPYYQALIENWGFEKEVDWTERKLYAPEKPDERIAKLSQKMMERYNLHFGTAKNTHEFIKKYGDGFFEILDQTYVDIYQCVPISERMKQSLIQSFEMIVNLRHVKVVLDENERIVCFGICFPSIAKALQKSGGRLTPAALVRLLRAIKHPKVIDLGLVGVLPEYRSKGIATAVINFVMEMLQSGEIEYAETNLNLEDNVNIQNQWKIFKNVQHKRRRCFVKKI